mmetsp:Transcript_9778/g.24422  ORF Transcript_9778/g.24422 Transcript_9778/m.24422 type:complete len:329 (+) Transcript_9778:81-1067(+)
MSNDPGMLEDAAQRKTSFRVLVQKTGDEIACLGADLWTGWKVKVDAGDAVVGLEAVRMLERRATVEQLVAEDTEAPVVDVGVVGLTLHHLGRQVVERTAESGATTARVHRPAKVGQLELPVAVHQQVLGLDVAMDHVLAVAKVQRIGQLSHQTRRGRLAKAAVLLRLEQIVELATLRELEHEEDARLVVKVRKQTQDVRVSQPCLNLDLASQLALHALLLQLLLEEHLQRYHLACSPLARHIHQSVAPTAQLATHLKVVQRPAAPHLFFAIPSRGGGGGAAASLYFVLGRVATLPRELRGRPAASAASCGTFGIGAAQGGRRRWGSSC